MLASSLPNADRYDFQSKPFQEALAFLRRPDLAQLPLGRVDIDGETVFANVQSYQTAPAASKHYEAHRRYIDVQYVVSGEEVISVAPTAQARPLQDFDEQNDFCLYDEPASCALVPLHAGDLLVVGPEDAHKPGCCLAGPEPVRKIVVKVAVEG